MDTTLATGARPSFASEAATDERLAFIRKVYAFLLAGLFVCGMTVYATATIPEVASIGASLWRSPLLYFALIFGVTFGVRMVSDRYPINIPAYFILTAFYGLMLAPLVIFAEDSFPGVVAQAGTITGVIFGGLTAYVFITKTDFSFLRGVLVVGLLSLFGVALAGLLFGFSVGVWYSYAAVAIFSGYILYDTSNLLHRYGTHQYVTAAIALFIDVVILFKHILLILMRSRD
jgi:FtsH-binding integral membrane protein